MRKIVFPAAIYEEVVVNADRFKASIDPVEKKALICKNEYKVSFLELLDIMLNKMSEHKCDKKDHKLTKKLKQALKLITRFKDVDEDSRVPLDNGPQTLLLEEGEFDILKKHLESATPKVSARVSEVLTDLWDLLDSAQEFTPQSLTEQPQVERKLELAKD